MNGLQTYFKKTTWGKIEAEFVMELPKESLISNVNVVPIISHQCMVIRLENYRAGL